MKFPEQSATGAPITPIIGYIWTQIIEGETPIQIRHWDRCQVCFGPAYRFAVVQEEGTTLSWNEQFCHDCWWWVTGIYERSNHGKWEKLPGQTGARDDHEPPSDPNSNGPLLN